MKKSWLLVFFFVPVFLFPQYLRPGDIDIFFNTENMEEFGEGMGEDIKMLEIPGLLSYSMSVKEVMEGLTSLLDNTMTDKEYTKFKTTYQRFMNLRRIPGAFERGFNRMGLDSGGHQKFWTMTFGTLFVIKEGEGAFSEGMMLKVMDLVGEEDMEIILNRKVDIKEFNERGRGHPEVVTE
jgi:hypothetical protein